MLEQLAAETAARRHIELVNPPRAKCLYSFALPPHAARSVAVLQNNTVARFGGLSPDWLHLVFARVPLAEGSLPSNWELYTRACLSSGQQPIEELRRDLSITPGRYDLRRLNLHCVGSFGDAGARTIVPLLHHNRHVLEELQLQCCGLGDEGLLTILRALDDDGVPDAARDNLALALQETARLNWLAAHGRHATDRSVSGGGGDASGGGGGAGSRKDVGNGDDDDDLAAGSPHSSAASPRSAALSDVITMERMRSSIAVLVAAGSFRLRKLNLSCNTAITAERATAPLRDFCERHVAVTFVNTQHTGIDASALRDALFANRQRAAGTAGSDESSPFRRSGDGDDRAGHADEEEEDEVRLPGLVATVTVPRRAREAATARALQRQTSSSMLKRVDSCAGAAFAASSSADMFATLRRMARRAIAADDAPPPAHGGGRTSGTHEQQPHNNPQQHQLQRSLRATSGRLRPTFVPTSESGAEASRVSPTATSVGGHRSGRVSPLARRVSNVGAVAQSVTPRRKSPPHPERGSVEVASRRARFSNTDATATAPREPATQQLSATFVLDGTAELEATSAGASSSTSTASLSPVSPRERPGAVSATRKLAASPRRNVPAHKATAARPTLSRAQFDELVETFSRFMNPHSGLLELRRLAPRSPHLVQRITAWILGRRAAVEERMYAETVDRAQLRAGTFVFSRSKLPLARLPELASELRASEQAAAALIERSPALSLDSVNFVTFAQSMHPELDLGDLERAIVRFSEWAHTDIYAKAQTVTESVPLPLLIEALEMFHALDADGDGVVTLGDFQRLSSSREGRESAEFVFERFGLSRVTREAFIPLALPYLLRPR